MERKDSKQQMERRKSILGSEGKEQRLIVISNRLPITCKKENGKWTFTRSSGGTFFAVARASTFVVASL
jgi:trehalose-6-phosphate synthase